MTGIWIGGAFLAASAFGWRMALLICAFVGALLVLRRRRYELLPAIFIIGVTLLGAARATLPPNTSVPPWADTATSVIGVIESAPTSTGRSQSFRLSVAEVEFGDEWQAAEGTICVSASPLPTAGLGDRIVVRGEARPLADQPGVFRAFLRSRSCDASLFARSFAVLDTGTGWQRDLADLRARLSGVLRRAAPGDSGALLSGLVTGDDHRLTDQRQDSFIRTGTTHITAVSGANLALIVTILVAVGTASGIRRHPVWQLVVVLAIWTYALLVGGEPPVVRAALVATGAIAAVRFGRRPDVLTLLALTAVLMVGIQPSQIWSLSFQLSFAASLGIVLVLAGVSSDEPQAGLKAALSATLAAQIATLPIVWFVIGEVSLTTLPANLLIAPLVSIAFPLAAFAGLLGLVWEPLATVVSLPARLCADLVLGVVDWLGGSPRTVAKVGVSSPLVMMLVSALATVAVLTMSPDFRRWALRLSARAGARFTRRESAPPLRDRVERIDGPSCQPGLGRSRGRSVGVRTTRDHRRRRRSNRRNDEPAAR